MAPKLHLPFPYCLVSLHFNGTPVPNGATCTFGVLPTDTSTPAQIATTIKAQLRVAAGPFGTGVGAILSNAVVLQDVTVKQGPMDTGPEASAADGQPIGGSSAIAAAPNLAMLLTKNTALGGKRGRGRMYIPGILSSVVGNGGQINGTNLTTLQASWNTFLSGMQSAGIGLSLLHNYDVAKGQTPMSPSTVTSLNLSGLMATQRNRMRR